MRFAFAICILASSITMPTAAHANEPHWSVRIGVEQTSLGVARPGGHGVTGGTTARIGVERRIGDVWALVPMIDARGYGFADDGPRTLGVELDAGVGMSRRFAAFGGTLDVGPTLSLGMYRAPFATAIGPMRFFGVRPAALLALSYASTFGAGMRLDAGCRYYVTLVWSGCAWSASASGMWTF